MSDIPEREVRTQTDVDAPAIVQAERARRLHGGAAQRFFRRQAKMRAGHRHRQAQRLQG